MNETRSCCIGIDLGGTNIKAGVVDAGNRLLATVQQPTGAERPWQQVAAAMAETAKAALEKAGRSLTECTFVGVGCPGTIDPERGVVLYSNNIAWENVPLAAELSRQLGGLPVRLSNDANCAALGEAVAGAAKGVKNVILLTLGTGVGGGIVWNGKLFEGGIGGAELGHTTLIAGGELCTCGRRGCVESYCSATALVHQAERMAANAPDSLLAALARKNGGKMNGAIPFDAMRQGCPVAAEVVRQYTAWLAEAIANYVNIFRPDVVLLSGGVSGAGAALTEPLNQMLPGLLFAKEHLSAPPVQIATLGNAAGIVGAANLGKENDAGPIKQ